MSQFLVLIVVLLWKGVFLFASLSKHFPLSRPVEVFIGFPCLLLILDLTIQLGRTVNLPLDVPPCSSSHPPTGINLHRITSHPV